MNINHSSHKNDEFKEANFKCCPACRSKDLKKFEVDLFCMDCDWNSILFDVNSGNFEKRIALMYQKPKSKQSIRSKTKLVHLPEECVLPDSNGIVA